MELINLKPAHIKPLIDLNLIAKLSTEARLHKSMYESYMLGYEVTNGKAVDMGLVMFVLKVAKQSKNLNDKLRELHKVCSYMANGVLDQYITAHEEFQEDENDLYDPFVTLKGSIDSGSIDDLPPQIEFYNDLCIFAPKYFELQKIKREGLTTFFGKIPKSYLFKDEKGNDLFIPESELPEDVLTKIEADRDIKDIQVEYSLDTYNEFYETCLSLIDAHQPLGDYQGCAASILGLFAPYTPRTPY